MTDHSHLPPHRKRSEEECKATCMLLNGGCDHDGFNYPWWYGNKAHMIVHDLAMDERGPHLDTRERFDADTMEPITKYEAANRIQQYEEWMANEAHRRRTYSESDAFGDVLPRR